MRGGMIACLHMDHEEYSLRSKVLLAKHHPLDISPGQAGFVSVSST